MEISVGMAHTEKTIVTSQNVASAVGSGSLDVFATPMMIALMEKAAASCIAGALSVDQSSVGTQINVSHSSATVIGQEIQATATVTSVDRRKVEFDILAKDSIGEIGKGTHTRFIIDIEPFLQKAQSKN